MSQTISNLPIGAKIKFGRHQVNAETPWYITWTVVAKNHNSSPAYPANSVTLHASESIDLRIYDAGEYGDQTHGNYLYSHSNIRQWLNSRAGAGKWFRAQHSDDHPPSAEYDTYGTEYASRPGFLYNFSDEEYNSILSTTVRTRASDAGQRDTVDKIFLPSMVELGLESSTGEGSTWEYYSNPDYLAAPLSQNVYDNTLASFKEDIPEEVLQSYAYFTRTRYQYYVAYHVGAVIWGVSDKDNTGYCIASVPSAIRPVINVSSSLLISDTTDSDGCYTTTWNIAPTAPSYLNVPADIHGGESISVAWGVSTISDGNIAGYILERSYDGGAFVQIYKGTNSTHIDAIEKGRQTVQYRVCAYSDNGNTGPYATGASRNVINNSPPVISGTDGSLGTKDNEFSQTYVVTDADSAEVRVIEAVDGVQVRSYVATLGSTNTFNVKGETWMRQSNGSHTMTITATDTSGNSTVRTYNFTKSINSFSVMNTFPYESTTRPSRIKLSITRNIPAEASFAVYVCNNGYDKTPTWEDATDSVIGSTVHVFENSTKTNELWGVKVRVEVARGAADGPCYVSQIGGSFE
jgi:hypothetical protein